MTILVFILALLVGRSHVYDGVNVGVTIGQHCGYEFVGDPGPFCNVD